MTKHVQSDDASNHKPLALIFLISFGALALLSIWLMYAQFAQVSTRTGQCTILSSQTNKEGVDQSDPTSDAALYAVTFQVSLLTADGQRFQVPGYYNSTNYMTFDSASAKALANRFPIGSTMACGYTYLDPSGTKALFEPTVALEGFLFPGFFLVVSLVVLSICIVALRRPPTPQLPFSDEALEVDIPTSADRTIV